MLYPGSGWPPNRRGPDDPSSVASRLAAWTTSFDRSAGHGRFGGSAGPRPPTRHARVATPSDPSRSRTVTRLTVGASPPCWWRWPRSRMVVHVPLCKESHGPFFTDKVIRRPPPPAAPFSTGVLSLGRGRVGRPRLARSTGGAGAGSGRVLQCIFRRVPPWHKLFGRRGGCADVRPAADGRGLDSLGLGLSGSDPHPRLPVR